MDGEQLNGASSNVQDGTPLVLSVTGGMANEATAFYKRLACCLAIKWEQPYSSTMSWLRCRLAFSLLRSAIQCIRGARSRCGHAAKSLASPLDLVTSDLKLISVMAYSFVIHMYVHRTRIHFCT